MTKRRLHAAPPDYGIVELEAPDGGVRVILYHWGAELLDCRTVDAARRLAEEHRAGGTAFLADMNRACRLQAIAP